MTWTARMPVATVALFVPLATALPQDTGRPGDHVKGDPREAHGVFTGEYKAVLYVSDAEESASFYRDTLGFDLEGFAKSGGEVYYAEMTAAGRKFGLHEPMTDAQKPRVGQQRLYFRVRDVDRHHARVVARGADPRAIKRTGWMDFFIVADADGNEIAFALTDPDRHATDPWGGPTAPPDPS